MKPGVAFSAGLIVSLVAALGLSLAISQSGDDGRGRNAPSSSLPEADIQLAGPFPSGQRISLAEAERRTPYALPVPPTDDRTGSLTGIWIDPSAAAIGFVWETDLRLYVYMTDKTPEQALAEYQQDAIEEPDRWTVTTARGQPALGANLAGPEPTSSLSFVERGLDILLVSPKHTLDQLRDLAEDIAYEEQQGNA